ncbi:MAG TPA: exo-beta-N-acetylmuramidase NamZ domain-containing protein [Pyrinomonadaceae bacterium]|jgi:uncharacterized protein YbbC (DUF1343 family)
MFERYTEKARRVIFFARYEASQFGAPAIEPEHLLLGLVREDKTLCARVMRSAKLSLEGLRAEIEARTPVLKKIEVSVELPLAPETKRVLAFAHEESDRLQHHHIGTEHLLLGLLREERSLAAEILYERGLRLNSVREQVAGHNRSASTQTDGLRLAEELRQYGRRLLMLADELTGRSQGEGEMAEMISELQSLRDSGGISAEGSERGKRAGRTGRRMIPGIERLLESRLELLRGARVGVICNQSSVDAELRHVADILHEHKEVKLTTLFGPQHGIRGDVQDNMIETPHVVDTETGLPIYSLYSETREPTERMLEETDVLVFDMQDVGCRIYTFVYTLANCMRAAKRFGKRVVVCDRPNPIGGVHMAGNILEPEYASFVGQFPLPTRHGMTVGELALMFREHFGLECDLEVVRMEGWSRELWFEETGAPWVLPSPNIPTPDTAKVFPGAVHLEGTQVSEGRGTTRPFELVGAPYIEAAPFARKLEALGLPGVRFRAAHFQPTFQKHAGETCGGVQIHVTDREKFEPVITGVAVVKMAYDLYTEQFLWKEPPYEYVFDKNPFDVIAGTRALRDSIEGGSSLESIEDSWRKGIEDFARLRERFLLY